MSKHIVPWAVIDYRIQPPVFHCTRCGNSSPLSLPLQIEQLVTLSEAFSEKHAKCGEKVAK